jgi:hypothetical protein
MSNEQDSSLFFCVMARFSAMHREKARQKPWEKMIS